MTNYIAFKKKIINNNFMVLVKYKSICKYKQLIIGKVFNYNNILFNNIKSSLLSKIFNIRNRFSIIFFFNNIYIFNILYNKLQLRKNYTISHCFFLNKEFNLELFYRILDFKLEINPLINFILFIKNIIIKLIILLKRSHNNEN